MDTAGACKDKHANCVKISYANAAHDNDSETGCTCGVANCRKCKSTSTCLNCEKPAAYNAGADWKRKMGDDCAGTQKIIYCANAAKVACNGACETPTNSNCGSNIFKADCDEYRLKDEGTN